MEKDCKMTAGLRAVGSYAVLVKRIAQNSSPSNIDTHKKCRHSASLLRWIIQNFAKRSSCLEYGFPTGSMWRNWQNSCWFTAHCVEDKVVPLCLQEHRNFVPLLCRTVFQMFSSPLGTISGKCNNQPFSSARFLTMCLAQLCNKQAYKSAISSVLHDYKSAINCGIWFSQVYAPSHLSLNICSNPK